MNGKVASGITGGKAFYKRTESDYYPTPPEATQALLDFLCIDKKAVIWEPACGQGHMTQVMRNNGYKVVGTDIITGTDYLKAIVPDCSWIITNPPFSRSQEFIERSILNQKPFAFLLK